MVLKKSAVAVLAAALLMIVVAWCGSNQWSDEKPFRGSAGLGQPWKGIAEKGFAQYMAEVQKGGANAISQQTLLSR